MAGRWRRAASAPDERRRTRRAGRRRRGAPRTRSPGAARDRRARPCARGSTSRPRGRAARAARATRRPTVLGSRKASSAVALKRNGGSTARPHTAQRRPRRDRAGERERPATRSSAGGRGAVARRRRRLPRTPAGRGGRPPVDPLRSCAWRRSRRPPPERRRHAGRGSDAVGDQVGELGAAPTESACRLRATRRRGHSRPATTSSGCRDARPRRTDREQPEHEEEERRARPCRGPTRRRREGQGRSAGGSSSETAIRRRPRQEPAIGGPRPLPAPLALLGHGALRPRLAADVALLLEVEQDLLRRLLGRDLGGVDRRPRRRSASS